MGDLLLPSVLIVAGVILLLVGGDVLVRSATWLARKLGAPPLLVGLTIVGFGTSAPEMVVSAAAAIEGAPGLALGNIVGSNIANILLVFGLPAILAPLATNVRGAMTNAVIALLASFLFIALTWDRNLGLIDGAVLAAVIVAYLIYLALHARGAQDDPVIQELKDVDHMPGVPRAGTMMGLQILIGLAFLPVGAQLVLIGGTGVAEFFEISEAVIGLTVLAFGTSLPELATACIAALRGRSDMAIGNVIGSNIFNLAAVGGITGLAAGAVTDGARVEAQFFTLDYPVMVGVLLVTLIFVFAKRAIGRTAGLAFLAGYGAYLFALARLNL